MIKVSELSSLWKLASWDHGRMPELRDTAFILAYPLKCWGVRAGYLSSQAPGLLPAKGSLRGYRLLVKQEQNLKNIKNGKYKCYEIKHLDQSISEL